MIKNEKIKNEDFVPIELWGRDHWSTLAYVETVLVEHGNFQCTANPRMRTCRRLFRIFLETKHANARNYVAMSPEHGSRLKDGTYLYWHDDWACIQDMIEYNVFKTTDGKEFDLGSRIKLTDFGRELCSSLRAHKQNGGNFSNFNYQGDK